MSEMVRVKDVVETVIPDNHFADVGKVADAVTPTNISKATMKAFRRAKKVSETENMRARQIVATLRSKREGTNAKPVTTHNIHTSTGGQASIFDY